MAGEDGYLVRWKVEPADGPDGYVQSLVFPSPDTGKLIGVRFGFDDTAEAPDLSVMDEIVRGIRTADTAADTDQGAV
ncbi:hypothetical protein C0036_10810 [Streptomyces sp. DJ]|nr:hypothetical protein C0036_10810 [Streptomyces sp. DJ]